MKSSPAPFDGSWAKNAWKRRKSQQFWVFLLGFTLPLLLGPVPISAQQWNKEAKNSLAVESSIDTASDSEVGEDTAYGQWMAKTEAAEGKVPMQFIRKFSWERTAGGAGQRPGAKEVERRRRPPVAEIEYDEVLAARLVAEEDVDRLSPAEGGDRPNFAVQPKWSTDGQAAGPNEQNQLAMTPWLSSVAPNFSSTSTARPKQPSMGVLQQQQQQQKSAFDRTMALSEMDLKSDWDLAKMMRRTTLKTRDFSGTGAGRTTPLMSTTTPLPFLAVPQPPPAFLGLLLPQSAPLAQQQQPWQQNRRGLRAEQFEQLGCGWDWLSQGCRDVFRFGWCQNCHDFGNPFLHDCRCTAVTGLYVQTATFLGSNAASARANAAVSAAAANQTGGTGGAIVPLLPGLSLLPTLEQLAAPLNSATGSPSPVASFSPSLMPPTVTPVSQMVQALANAFQLPQPTAAPSLSLLGVQPAADQAPARPISGSPLLGPPAFGAVQFAPAGNQIVPRYISVGSGKKKRR